MTRACVALLLFGFFGTPLHLAFEDHHDWRHEHGEHQPHDEGSERDTHPAVDHEVTAFAGAPRFTPPVVDVLILRLDILPPETRTWTPAVEPEAQSPPEVFASPPRSPRSPPV